ncbi:MAG: STM4012 family radical SAM protein [Pirellulales bacterium]|nr:STM4012 family radical SAM protein [Pirellulales bacterium]
MTARSYTPPELQILSHQAPAALPADAELVSYAYSYPHKSSYQPLLPPVPLADAWAEEDLGRLALYVHLPFCEMRCGFCNLFTQSQPQQEEVAAYLHALARQIRVVSDILRAARFAVCALGGGTPTFLSPQQLDWLFDLLGAAWNFDPRHTPTSVEASPATASTDRLRTLAQRGVHRLSLGVQSFVEAETRALGRPQRPADAHAALETIRSLPFAALNVDLIYGHPSQSLAGWLFSLREVLRYQPEEIYLYPLYVRPQTGLARRVPGGAALRSDLYRAGREHLLAAGYTQISHRCFRLQRYQPPPVAYGCQRDGMLGLGCGARSYTRTLHYGSRFAVTQQEIRDILRAWITQDDAAFALATHGCRLSTEEQRRRYVILSVLEAQGLCVADYQKRFGTNPHHDLPELNQFIDRGWLVQEEGRIHLTAAGLEHADSLGPALYSAQVRRRLREFVRL